jgi:hypothetical protein
VSGDEPRSSEQSVESYDFRRGKPAAEQFERFQLVEILSSESGLVTQAYDYKQVINLLMLRLPNRGTVRERLWHYRSDPDQS